MALLFSVAKPLVHVGRAHYEEQVCAFISNSGQWFKRRCGLKYFLSGALVALCKRCQREHSCEIILNLDQLCRRRCRLKKKLTDEGRQTNFDHNISHCAFRSGELKRR